MAVLVYILGRTGTGKSYSMRNFPKDKLAIVNVQGKILPFRGGAQIETTNTDDWADIKDTLTAYSKRYNAIVVDDFQYLMSNEFMRRAMEKGYDKFTEIASHAWEIADSVRKLPRDTIVYVMCHTDTDSEGIERLKTIGKLLDEKIFLEGMSTIVLKTVVSDGKYSFVTQNNGKDTVKSPADMFPSYGIANDLWYVDQKIREYYGMEGADYSAEELAEADKAASVDVETGKKRRGSERRQQSDDSASNTATGGRRRSENPEVLKVKEENAEAVAEAGLAEADAEGAGEDGVDFDKVAEPEIKPEPRRRGRASRSGKTADAEAEAVEAETEPAEAEPTEVTVGLVEVLAESVEAESVEAEAPKEEPATSRRRRRR